MNKPSIEILKKQLLEAQEALDQADRKSRESQTVLWKEIISNPDNYEWMCQPTVYKQFPERIQIDGVIVKHRIKPDILKKWKEGGFATFHTDLMEEDRWFGIVYYRTDENILTHDGGGTLVLKDPKLCSDEEWNMICSGNIPDKFKRVGK